MSIAAHRIVLSRIDRAARTENVSKLKYLEYLNLSMNNVETIEGLSGCESLKKLDLTMNFIPVRNLIQITKLKANHQLRELFLTGNPCTDFEGYRLYTIANLPQLTHLDGVEITSSERIVARQRRFSLHEAILQYVDHSDVDRQPDAETVSKLESEQRPWCPATRIIESNLLDKALDGCPIASQIEKTRDFEPLPDDTSQVKQKNQGDFTFTLTESLDETALILEVKVDSFLDTSLIRVDIHPLVVRVMVKDELLQLKLSDEVSSDASTAERSRASGKLLIKMPKANWHVKVRTKRPVDGSQDDVHRAKIVYDDASGRQPPTILL